MNTDPKISLLHILCGRGGQTHTNARAVHQMLCEHGVINADDYHNFFTSISTNELTFIINGPQSVESMKIMISENISKYTEDELVTILHCCVYDSHQNIFLSDEKCVNIIQEIPIEKLSMIEVFIYHTIDDFIEYLNDKTFEQIIDEMHNIYNPTKYTADPLVSARLREFLMQKSNNFADVCSFRHIIKFLYLFDIDDAISERVEEFIQTESNKHELIVRIHYGEIVFIETGRYGRQFSYDTSRKLVKIYERIYDKLINVDDIFGKYIWFMRNLSGYMEWQRYTFTEADIDTQLTNDIEIVRQFYKMYNVFDKEKNPPLLTQLSKLQSEPFDQQDVAYFTIEKANEYFALIEQIKEYIKNM